MPRAALVGLWKNSDPAIDTVRQASPHTLTACAYTSRANGVGSAKRGSVLIFLPDVTPSPSMPFGPVPGDRERGVQSE